MDFSNLCSSWGLTFGLYGSSACQEGSEEKEVDILVCRGRCIELCCIQSLSSTVCRKEEEEAREATWSHGFCD